MKPNFALDFRNDAVTLWHRSSAGWQQVGRVGLDAPDLAGALADLRGQAQQLSPDGVMAKLVIPNDQILYTRIPVTAQDGGRRRKQVARALEGMTPYAVADLAFDLTGTGPEVDVAVIAKETLAEAEAFATEHGFNPVSFVATPDAGAFAAEPWFGPSAAAATLLPQGQKVERDNSPVARAEEPAPAPVAPPVAPPAAPPVPDAGEDAPRPADRLADTAVDHPADLPAEVAPDAAPQPAPDPTVPFDLPPVADTVADTGATPEPADPARMAATPPGTDLEAAVWADPEPVSAAAPEPDPAAPPASADLPEAAQPEPEEVLARVLEEEARLAAALPEPPSPSVAASAPADLSATTPASAPITGPIPGPIPGPAPDEAPIALDVVDDQPEDRPKAPAGVLDPSIPDDLPPPPAASVMVAFGSRRALEASAKEAAARAGGARPGVPRPATPGKGPALVTPGLGTSGGVSGGLSGATRNSSGQAKVTTLSPRPGQGISAQSGPVQSGVVRLPSRSGGSGPVTPLDTLDMPGRPAIKPALKPAAKPSKASAAGKALRGLGALVTSPGIAGAKERRPVPPQVVTPPTGPTSAATAAAATLTKPVAKPYSGGLGNRSLERPKPRYLGLILTGILLVFLGLVAAWSTLFLEARNTTDPDPTAVAGVEPATGAGATAAPTVEDEMLADLQDPDPAEPAPLAAAPTPAADAEAEAVADAVAAAAPVAEAAPFGPLDTEAAAVAPLVATPQDEFLLATMDQPPEIPDALSLPLPRAGQDTPPAPAVPPPPFGTVIQFDADGLVVPTPEGILTPDGVLLFAGRPALEPPPRPASIAALAAARAPADPAAEPTAATPAPPLAPAADAFPADPALAGARPRPRPASLVPPTQNADDDASLAPTDGSRFASLRPRAKPAALAAAAAPAPTPTETLGAQAASLTAQANAATATATGAQSSLILAVSRKPAPRPADMSAAVEAAVAVASRQPDPKPPVDEPTARTEPEADDEPEVTSAMPRLPTKTTVAKQATYVNAINLSKINLIGIYGSSSDRYALIRQTNGRYKKVQVGDNFDGGKVAAITTSEVRYQKSGKMVTLSLPKG